MIKNHVAIVDYGMGNLRSVQNAIALVGGTSEFVTDPEKLKDSAKIILPGVGAFEHAIKILNTTGLAAVLEERKQDGAYILGICLGMQLMCRSSEEDGLHKGLNWFDARVIRFDDKESLTVPHMGWNGVDFIRDDLLFRGLETGEDGYFVHSYHTICENESDVLATTEYGIRFQSIIQSENVRGIQFHPEKSQEFGLRIMRNFLELVC